MSKIVVLDPGHGGTDSGALGNGLVEKNLTLELALMVQNRLAHYVDVTLTRSSDVFIGLTERADRANNLKADLFVSLHINAGGGTGFESYIRREVDAASVNVQNIIHKEVAAYYLRFGFPDRGKKRADFVVLRRTTMPAILLENLFIDTIRDADKLGDSAFLNGAAEAISTGILKALGIQPGSTAPPTTVPPSTVPVTAAPHWAQQDFDRLRKTGLVSGEHNLDSNVTWGELSAVVARLLDKLGI